MRARRPGGSQPFAIAHLNQLLRNYCARLFRTSTEGTVMPSQKQQVVDLLKAIETGALEGPLF
jgi:hypothetical protein